MINAHSLQLSFGSRVLFDSISFDIRDNQRIGLIGANGSGKSTLLEVLVGIQPLDDGSITVSKNKKIAYLAQDVVLNSALTVFDETMTAFEQLAVLTNKLQDLEKKLAISQYAADVEEYAYIHEELAQLQPALLEVDAKRMLIGLGFKHDDFQKPVATLSIGWRMRIVLAKLLLQKADFYLFDEPTNHLDIFAKDWFLDFLQNASFGFMLVCHERYFLDKVCKQIFELEMGKATIYQGNFSAYEIQKEHKRALLESAYQLQEKEIKQKQETINRFKASASRAKQAQSMIKQLEKIERIVLPPTLKSIQFNFPPIERAGKVVVKVENVGHTFDKAPLFENINFEIERGQKVALVAANGGGKSTLLNIINGKLPLQKGSITFGSNVSYALFDQDQNAALDGQKTILDNINKDCPATISSATIRSFLGAFLFSGEDVQKKVSVLSGGEKNRVGMVKVLLQKSNVLFLDEPTNHLDLDSKKILLQALRAYEGTIIFVSHDRAFLNDLATRIIELTPTGVISFAGNYDEFLYYKNHLPANHSGKEHEPIVQQQPKAEQKNNYELIKKSRSLERKIDQLEKKINAQELDFAQLIYGTDAYKKAEWDLKELKQQRDSCMQEWEALQNQM